jgi:hypothetical protein
MEPIQDIQQSTAPAVTDTLDLDSIASELLALVTKIENVVPGFEAHDKREISRVAARARFAHELIAPTITIVTSVPTVPQDLFKVARAREALHVVDLLRPIARRLSAFAHGLDFTIDTKLSLAGEDALQTYHWAKRAARGPKGAALRPYLDEMRRVVKRAINRSKKPKSDSSATPPAPQGQGFMAALPQRAAEDVAAGAEESSYKVAADEP